MPMSIRLDTASVGRKPLLGGICWGETSVGRTYNNHFHLSRKGPEQTSGLRDDDKDDDKIEGSIGNGTCFKITIILK